MNENITLKKDDGDTKKNLSDLTDLDFEKLRAAFANDAKKEYPYYNMQQAIEKKLDRMGEEKFLIGWSF